MKQGRAQSSMMGDSKVEPSPKAVNPEAVSRIGLQKVYYKPVPMYTGKGYKAPNIDATTYHCGTQGRH